MDKERIKQIVANERANAERILNGDGEYDGADGARTVIELCECCEDLLKEQG